MYGAEYFINQIVWQAIRKNKIEVVIAGKNALTHFNNERRVVLIKYSFYNLSPEIQTGDLANNILKIALGLDTFLLSIAEEDKKNVILHSVDSFFIDYPTT